MHHPCEQAPPAITWRADKNDFACPRILVQKPGLCFVPGARIYFYFPVRGVVDDLEATRSRKNTPGDPAHRNDIESFPRVGRRANHQYIS